MTMSYTVYNEAGGAHKTTTGVNLSEAHSRQGLNTLYIDGDQQEANGTYLKHAGDDRDDGDADNLVRHMLGQPRGDLRDLIQTTDEGFDVLPAHDMIEDFTELLLKREDFETNMGNDDFNRFDHLHRVLWQENSLQDDYDVIIVDPNAQAENMLVNAIYATRTIVVPAKPAGKGSKSLKGLSGLLSAMSEELGIDIGVAAVILSGVSNTATHQRYVDKIDAEYGVAGQIGKRESLMDEMWDARGSAFKVVEKGWLDGEPGKRGVRDREIDTLETILDIADDIADQFDVAPPNTPEIKIEGVA
ncbi:ParA family protein [Halocatena halophila]|uniref:ParA family protein n=1 Tax=Halocatena halophila TaxID=2814576 RepID=UPI002ED3417C